VLSREIFEDMGIFPGRIPSNIAMDVFPRVPSFEGFLGTSKAIGHLEILKEKESVKVREQEGKDYSSLGT